MQLLHSFYNFTVKFFVKVVGNRGSIEINPRLMMMKESSVIGVLLFKASQVSIITLFLLAFVTYIFININHSGTGSKPGYFLLEDGQIRFQVFNRCYSASNLYPLTGVHSLIMDTIIAKSFLLHFFMVSIYNCPIYTKAVSL